MPWEETENEIRHRERDPADFNQNSFRRIALKASVPRVYGIIGHLSGETKTTLQSMRFPKTAPDNWTMAKAKEWRAKHSSNSQTEIIRLGGQTDTVPLPLPVQHLAITFTPDEDADRENRIVPLTWYTGATVRRYGWSGSYELTFSMDPAHIRMGRLNNGAPLLNSHRDRELGDQIGVIEKAWLEDGKGKATVRFSSRPDVQPIFNDVLDGIIRNASMGVAIHKLKETSGEDDKTKSYLAVDWEPEEISLVPVGADDGAGFKGSEGAEERAWFAHVVGRTMDDSDSAAETGEVPEVRATSPQEEAFMPSQTDQAGDQARTEVKQPPTQAVVDEKLNSARALGVTAEQGRITSILNVAKVCQLPLSFAEQHIHANTTIEAFRAIAIEEQGKRQAQIEVGRVAHFDIVRDEADSRRRAMTGALLERFLPNHFAWDDADKNFRFHRDGQQRLYDGSRMFASCTLLDIAKACLEVQSIRWQTKSRTQIAELAFQSTSDFPSILADVAGKSLRAGYEAVDSQWRLIAARRTAADFKAQKELILDSSSRLEKVAESGEFTRGKLVEGKEQWALSTYGRIISITRQAVINDDLGAFTRTPQLLGQEVAMLEADTVYGIVIANPVMADGNAVFHVNHTNLIAVGTAISVDSMGAMRVLLMTQKSPGLKVLGVQPRYLLAPAAKAQLAEQYTSASYVAAQQSSINPLAGRIIPIIEARLDASSATAWYFFADPNMPNGVVLIYAYLEGQEGPYTETRNGFDVDGVEVKIRHDFAAAVVDYRGAAKNPGA